TFDEAGNATPSGEGKAVVIECVAEHVKITRTPVTNPPGSFIERRLFRLTGAGLKSKLFLLGPAEKGGRPRLLVHNKAGKVTRVFEFEMMDITPCHPGCFPAGTPVATPKGPRPVDRIGVGDEVTTVGEDGKAGATKVRSVFVTFNRLLRVET